MALLRRTCKSLIVLVTGSVCAVSTVGQLAFPPLEGEYSISRGTPGDQTHSRIGLRPGGGTIVWQDNATDGDGLGISARALNNNFSPIASRTYRINQLGEGDQENPDIAILPDGGAAYVWQGGVEGQQDIWLRLQDSDGIFLSSEETRVNLYQAGMQQDPVIGQLENGTLMVSWASDGQDGNMQGIFVRRFSAAGQALGDEFQANQFSLYNQRTPAGTPLGGNRYVLAWVSEQQRFQNSVDVFARLFDGQGEPLSDEFLVNTGTNLCANPSVAPADNGGFVIGWSERNLTDPENGWDVMVRAFGADGNAIGESERVNGYLPGDQYGPRISYLDGTHLVVWTSVGQDGSMEGVPGRYLENGVPAGQEFGVNSTRISKQIHPVVANDGRRRFLVSWSSFVGGQASFDLFAQRFAAEQTLPPPAAPLVAALDQRHLSVTWPELAGYEDLAHYKLKIDEQSDPVSVTSNALVAEFNAPGSQHTFRLAYVLEDGTRSPWSEPASGQTWGWDDNLDGLPDDWQSSFWGGEHSDWPGSQEDSDGDGATNVEEFLAGTNPTEGTSVLKTEIVNTSQGLRLTWNTQPGYRYQVQVSDDVQSWTDIGNARFAPGEQDSIPVEKADGVAYYRVIRLR